jgi:hypothetical protein
LIGRDLHCSAKGADGNGQADRQYCSLLMHGRLSDTA